MTITGILARYDGAALTVTAPFTDTDFLVEHDVRTCTMILDDGRQITALQRRYIYAMLRDIGFYTGHETEFLKEYFKGDTIARTGGRWFSLADCSMTEANELIETLLEFCIEWQIPTKDDLAEFAPDIERYVYWCLKNRVCCVSRLPGAELHHVDHVGMGRGRREIPHLGMRAMPLLRKYHDEAHRIGQCSFEEKYHIHGIPLTTELCAVWNLKAGE